MFNTSIAYFLLFGLPFELYHKLHILPSSCRVLSVSSNHMCFGRYGNDDMAKKCYNIQVLGNIVACNDCINDAELCAEAEEHKPFPF